MAGLTKAKSRTDTDTDTDTDTVLAYIGSTHIHTCVHQSVGAKH